MKKRWIAWGLLLAMILTLLPGAALAAAPTEGACGPEDHPEAVRWTYQDGTLTVSGRGPMANFGFDWDMQAPWHDWLEQIRECVIEEGVTRAGANAFSGCSALETLDLPATLEEISGMSSLESCAALREIRVAPGNPVFFVEDQVLYNRSTGTLIFSPSCRAGEECTVAAGTKNIREYAFQNNQKLRRVVLPEGLQTIGSWVFSGCTALEEINVPESLQSIGSHAFEDTALYRDPARREGPLLYLDSWLIAASDLGKNTDLVIREGTLGLADWALSSSWKSTLRSVSLPDSLRYVGACAFYRAEFGEILLPEGLREIGACAFEDCAALGEIRIPASVTKIGASAFEGCTALREAHIPAGVTDLGGKTFYGCPALKDIYFGGSRLQWETLCEAAGFYDGGRTKVHFAGSTEIKGVCGDHLTWTLDNGLLTIEGTGEMYDFDWDGNQPWEKFSHEIQKAVVKDGVTSVGECAFLECRNLAEISLPDSVTAFGNYAFFNCRSLKTLRLPAGLTELDPGVFRGCLSLGSLTVSPENESYLSRDGAVYSRDGRALCCYPRGRQDSAFVLAPGTETIEEEAISGNPFLCAVGADRSLRKVDSRSFGSCAGLTDFYYEGSSDDWAQTGNGDPRLNLHFLWTPGSEMPVTLRASETANWGWEDYTKWSAPVTSYLIPHEDGTLTRLEAAEGAVFAEEYDRNRTLTGRRLVTVNELPLFGGFYETEENYFLVFGAKNTGESDACEVIRTVRYDKNWNRQGDARILGDETYRPFDAASLRMTACGDYLYVITGREIYAIKGIHHQTSYMYRVHIPTMTAETGGSWDGCCSHSFNQFIALEGNHLVTVNHGDAYPRAVTLCRFTEDAGQKEFRGQGESTDLLKISGSVGDNVTGASAGGLEVTDRAIVTAGSTEDQSAAPGTVSRRNIFLISLDRETGNLEQRFLTDYGEEDSHSVRNPYLIKLSENRLLVLWAAYREDLERTDLYGQFTDGAGKPEGDLLCWEDAVLSDCRPVLSGNALTWYVTRESAPVFYSLPLDHPKDLKILRVQNNSMTGMTKTVCGGGKSCPSHKFTDAPAPGHWAHEGVDYAVSRGLFGGMSETAFGPDISMSRAMLVTVLWRYEKMPRGGRNVFSDVPEGQWFTEPVAWAAANGIVGGIGDGKFDPEGNVTREQMAAILYRYAEKKGLDVSRRGDLTGFPDRDRVSGYAVENLRWAVGEKLIGGSDGWLLPQGSATRAQVATILMRFIENTEKP